jgi:hypothetical protein
MDLTPFINFVSYFNTSFLYMKQYYGSHTRPERPGD